MEYKLEVNNEITTDVLVIGAGTAGVFAAISAAKGGASVTLVEKGSMPGGTVTSCGVDFPGIFHAWGRQIIDGPCFESIKRAEALGGAVIPEIVYQPDRHWKMQVRLNVFTYVHVLEEMLSECGVRESLRIDAHTNITSEDYVAGKIYDDAVCYAFYPVDLHTDHAIKQTFLAEGVVPTIPYSSLVPKGSKYILACGRIIGSDTDANSALRVQAPCMASGQVCGAAAAMMAKNGSDVWVDYKTLCDRLEKIGAVVPKTNLF